MTSLVAIFKFSFLNSGFWENAFVKNGVYSQLSTQIKNEIEVQITKQGGKSADIRSLTGAISSANLETTIKRNIENILGFINQTEKELNIFIPVKILPENFLPKNLSGLPEQIPINQFLATFNAKPLSPTTLKNISNIGPLSTYAFATSLLLTIFILALLFLITDKGKRFTAVGIALVYAGISILTVLILKSAVFPASFSGKIVAVIFRALLTEITGTVIIISAIVIFSGIVLLFIKRPGNVVQLPCGPKNSG